MTDSQSWNSGRSPEDPSFSCDFSFCSLGFSIRTNSVEVYKGARRFFEHFPPAAGSADERSLILRVQSDGWLYDFPLAGEHHIRTGDLPYIFVLLDAHVLNHFRSSSTQHWVMHAGMVARAGKGILLPGGTTHGKSTLTAMLVHEGLDYLGDEHVILDREGSLAVRGFPRPIVLREDSYEKIREIVPALEPVVPPLLIEGKGDFYIDPENLRPGSVAEQAELLYIVFPHYAPDESPALVPISKADAMVQLLRGFLHFKHFRAAAIEGLSNIVDRVPCYSLITGQYKETVSLISELLSSNDPQTDA